MKTSVRRLCLVMSSLAACAPLIAHAGTSENTVPSAPKTSLAANVRANFGHLPLGFEKNTGQTAPEVQWLARTPESTLYLSGTDATVQLNHIDKVKRNGIEVPLSHRASLRMSLIHAQTGGSSAGEGLQPGKVNYFTGNDASQWQKDVPMYGKVRLDQVYPGISLLYHGELGRLEYDFVVAPKADPGRIALRFTGAQPTIAANGDLLLPIPGDSTVHFDKPVVYQIDKGKHIPVSSAYRLASNGQVSFQLGRYDHTRELIIDPKLVFLGTLGAGNYPYATNTSQITVDSTGALYFIGTTNDPNFPVTSSAYQKVCGPATGNNASAGGVYCGTYGATSAYVTKISADGTSLVYSTYLSGHGGYEQGTSIAVDSAGIAYLLGATASNDFPVTGDAFQSLCQPGQNPGFGAVIVPAAQCNNFGDGGGTEYTVNGPVFFYAKLSANGSSLMYASFLGGSDGATPVATALDSAGNWYLYGQTAALLAANVYPVSGGSEKVQFPGVSSSGYQTVSHAVYVGNPQQPEDISNAGVLSKFSNDGKTLLYGTFFADQTNGYDFNATSLAIGANGIAFIGGWSNASKMPTSTGAIKTACTTVAGNPYTCTTVDGWVAAFDTTKSGGASLVYATRIGGAATAQGSNTPNQEVLGLAANSSNDVYATGYTYDQTFPVPSTGYMPACNTADPNNTNNCGSAWVLELNPTGSAILAGSFLSGPAAYYESSVGYKVKIDSNNKIYLYGTSQDGYNTFPLVNPVQGYSDNSELYIATMSSDLTQLLFSTRLGNPSLNGGNALPINGLALDSSNNIYFAGTTNDSTFAATSGTYATAANSGTENHTFFGKISAVLLPSTATLSASPTGSVVSGTSVTFTATVAGTGGTTPTGTVTFLNGTATLGTGALSSGQATYTTAALTTGAHSVTASYGGDGNFEGSISAALAVTVTAPAAPTVTISVSPTSITVGQSATVTWSSTNATACTASSAWTGTQGTSGTLKVTPTAAGSLSYALACTGAGGSANGTAALTVTAAAPTVTISVSPTSITVGQSATVTWSSTNATACTASSAWTGAQAATGTLQVTPTAAGSLSYALDCTGAGGSAKATAALTVAAAVTTSSGTTTTASGGGGGGSMNGWMLAVLSALAVTARSARRRQNRLAG